ncbi:MULTISPECIES: glycosyltransferase family 9 protein [Vibrio]|uniref:glycosyltransferase family 9 protein n=1 Tax=Vibrio TaxID=662 RepID=UPI00265D1497|nr:MULTISPECIES: glycosyltransferase family 9 protein [Vibrio]MCS0047971.1 glycosyltransferase family 9 protein [Vibrio antiquarius]MDW1904046.1 glycosyltransferase family 9 protein [Vibrio sp. 705]
MNKKILIVNTHGMGDVVMTLPAIKELLDMGYQVSLLIKSRLEEEVIRSIFSSDVNDSLECFHLKSFQKKGIVGYWSLLTTLRTKRFDMAMAAYSSHDIKFNTLAYLSGSSFRVGLGGRLAFLNTVNVNDYESTHKASRNLEIAARIDSKVTYQSPDMPKYEPTHSTHDIKKEHGLDLNKEIVALAPGCGELEKHKRWPIQKFADLAQQLADCGKQVLIIGGPGEEHLSEYILEHTNTEYIVDFVGQLTIQTTLDLLFVSNSLVANCNGLSHLGSLIKGLEIVGLYGPTNPSLTGPLSKGLKVVSKNLECAPCYKRGYITGCGNAVCMEKISVDSVISEL